jgi:hypothetical protein
MGKDNTLIHERDCNECNEMNAETRILNDYRKFFKEDMSDLLDAKLNEHGNNTKRINTIDKWLWKIEFKFGPVYLLTVAVVLIIIYLIIDKIG